MFEILLLDLDDTILDFHKAEHIAIGKTFREMGLAATDAVRARYSAINKACWEALERGEMTRAEVLVERFARLFAEYGCDADPTLCARTYERNLGIGHYFLPGAEEAMEALFGKYRLFLTSNGTASVQKGRMESANLYRFFERVFVSQEIGANKPAKAYFDRCFAQIPDFDPKKALIVGDSLSSDILGGNNAGIATCWVNPGHKPHPESIRVDYEIQAFAQLPALLKALEAASAR